ncbi:hypothetical protein ACWEOW_17000 [Monashia sp. NPDC004114]
MTIRFNPPPGWPTPPATWVPQDEWLPDPSWPDPPAGWSFWTVTVRPTRPDPTGKAGKGTKVSFPVATAAAQSTVSLAALFPERGRYESPTFGGYGTTGVPDSPPEGVPTKAGREYYRPRGWGSQHGDGEGADRGSGGAGGDAGAGAGGRAGGGAGGRAGGGAGGRAADRTGAGGSEKGRIGSVLNGSGPMRDQNGAPVPDLGVAGTAIDPTVLPEPDGPGAGSVTTDRGAQGIRLSPILRLVSHPSGLRAQFRVGGPVAAALAEVMSPAIEVSVLQAGRVAEQSHGRGGRVGRLGFLRRGRRGDEAGDAGGPPGRASSSPLSITDLVHRSLAARRSNDLAEAASVEAALCAMHRYPFTPLRPPTPAPLQPVTPDEQAPIHRKALEAVGANEPGLSKPELAARRGAAVDRVEALVRAMTVARTVFAGRRKALAEGGWQLLAGHDPATVVAVVDEALRLSGSDVTCLDAGVNPINQRAYVTVLVRFAPMIVIADDGVEESASGRPVWRARTPFERNGLYAAGLASAVLAAAKQVDCVAPAADDVNVVVVRPSRNGRSVEPVYVGTLDREDVSLRHPDADPLPLVASSAAPHGLRIDGPDREVTALDRAADVDGTLREIVAACRAAMTPPPSPPTPPGPPGGAPVG